MKIYGYVRVSTEQQNCANQHHEIETFCRANNLIVNEWVEEVISSRKALKDRRLGKLLKKLQKDDILMTLISWIYCDISGITQGCTHRLFLLHLMIWKFGYKKAQNRYPILSFIVAAVFISFKECRNLQFKNFWLKQKRNSTSNLTQE